MKKTFSFYAIIWALFLALFNVIVFVTPNELGGMSKFGGAFWVGYVFITIAFIGQLVCAYFAFKPSENQKLFYNIPLISISYVGLIIMLIAGTACMAIPNLPNWIGIIVCLLVLAFTAVAVLKATLAISIVTDIDQKVKTKTYFVKALTVDAEHLMNTAKNAELKALAKKVYEAVRYSDPMSNAVLVEVEEKIQNGFSDFENAVNGEDYELATSTSNELLSLIDIRNKKCKLLK
ncbi:MAG: hypothetical protein E7531_01085 [Ruminococcaceae bacterium]|nr:hypothetical protein [Oscillospiraceae bacterium]